MEKKYICTCYIKNVNDKIASLNGEVYLASNNFLRIDYPNTTGFYASNFSIHVDDIYECNNNENNELEIICFTDTYSLSHVDSKYEDIGNHLYKFTIHLVDADALRKDILLAKKKILEKNKDTLERLINQKTKKLLINSKNYIKIKGLYGRTLPKKILYTGVVYDSYNEKCLTIQFDNSSEKKYLGQQFGNKLSNTRIDINYEEIIDYYIKSKKIHIKVYDNGNNQVFTKELLYFGNLMEDDVFEIILEGEELQKIKQLLSKRVALEEKELLLAEKKEEKMKKLEEKEEKYNKKSSKGLGFFIIFYILFYPIFWIISLPFMIISNITGSYKKFSPNKTWNDWWNTKS